jgi:hypothetical protein
MAGDTKTKEFEKVATWPVKPCFFNIEFSQLKLQPAHIYDIACDAGHLYSVTNSDSALSN